MKVNSYNEWDKLREVIVGTADGTVATLSWMKPDPIPPKVLEEATQLSQKASPKWFYDEVSEDLQGLADVLTDFGAKVLRPKPFDYSQMFSTPFWTTNSNNVYNTRDLNLVVGNSVIESPSYLASRYYETGAMYDIWYEYFDKGFKWIAAPKPLLNYEAKTPYFRDESERELTYEDRKHIELTGGRLEKLHNTELNERISIKLSLELGEKHIFDLLNSSLNL